jgi:UDP-3-O-[3-hydroxymyristoyl] glucosamine N-acyltransferase
MKLAAIADHLACQVIGDPTLEITGLATIEEAQPTQLTFISNIKYRRYLTLTKASAVIIDDPTLLPEGLSAIISPHPYLTFAQALSLFFRPPQLSNGIHPQAYISASAHLSEGVSIGPFTVIGDHVSIGLNTTILSHCAIYPGVKIGAYSLIHSHCVIREGCCLGDHVILQNAAIVGTDGFGYAKRHDQSWHKIPQTGTVILQDEVEIGSGTVIDRATLGTTRIGHGTKIDNLVQIGHGSTVGERSLLCAQAGLAGSTRVGNEVIIGGQAGAGGHLTIGDKVIATPQTGIPNSVEPGSVISGSPAIDHRNWLKSSAVFAQLPQLQQELRRLKARIEELESRLQISSSQS